MSIKAMGAVWEHSRQTLGARLVALALADYAHDDGSNAYPSIATLARKAHMSERNVQYALRRLEQAGEIERQGTHVSGTTIWRLTLPGTSAKSAPANIAPGAKTDTGGVQNPVKPDVENCTLTVIGVNQSKEPPLSPPKGEYTDEFEHFWKRYPRVLNNSKAKAAKVWGRMTPAARELALAGLDKYLTSDGWQRGYAPHTTTYLNGKLWQTDPPEGAARPNSSNGSKPEDRRPRVPRFESMDLYKTGGGG